MTPMGVYKHAKKPVSERLWSKVDKNGPISNARPELGRCWLWTAYLNEHGYGLLSSRRDKAPRKAHVLAYELTIGPIPNGLQLDHLCRVRNCVNPTHLEPVTSKENNLRGQGISAKNARKTHCKHGHPFSGKNLYVRPSDKSRACIKCRILGLRRWYAKKRKNAKSQ